MEITKLIDSIEKVSKVPTSAALSISAILTAGCVIAINKNMDNSIILVLIGSSFIALIIGIILHVKDKRTIERIGETIRSAFTPRKEPYLQEKGKENVMFETNYGYKVIEHYSTEYDPKLSFITAIKHRNDEFTVWFRVQDLNDPIESRFYVEEGAAIFELYHAEQNKTPLKCDKSYVLYKDESIIIPDSWWCRFKVSQDSNSSNTANNLLKMIVLCMPRFKEGSHHTAKDIRELVP